MVIGHAWLAGLRTLQQIGENQDIGTTGAGLRGQDIDPMLGTAAWKSHNYAHLMEQPTIFYATVFILHITQAASPLMVKFAWAYVALRIIHSVYQSTINKVMVRFSIFMLSTVCLVVLAVNAVMATI